MYKPWSAELSRIDDNMQKILHEQEVIEKIRSAESSIMRIAVTNSDNYRDIFANDFVEKMMYRELTSNITYVNTIFEQINQTFGSGARNIVWEIYVEGTKEKEIENTLHISNKTLRRRINDWLTAVLITGRQEQ